MQIQHYFCWKNEKLKISKLETIVYMQYLYFKSVNEKLTNDVVNFKILAPFTVVKIPWRGTALKHSCMTPLVITGDFSGQFLAHLSQRLIGELIGYQWSRRPSVVRPS